MGFMSPPSINNNKRRAEDVAHSNSREVMVRGSEASVDELEFEDEFEDEFEQEEFVEGEEGEEGEGGLEASFADDGVNPRLGGRLFRAGDELNDGEELQVSVERPARDRGLACTQPKGGQS